MVTKSILDMLEMDNITDYFEYIVDSKINGQHTQARELFAELSDAQVMDFFDWAEANYYYEAQDSDEMDELQILRGYFAKK
jgi:hypothetical protein